MADISPSSVVNSIHVVPMLQRNTDTMVQPRQVYTEERNGVEYKLQDYMTVRPNQAPYATTKELYSRRLWIC